MGGNSIAHSAWLLAQRIASDPDALPPASTGYGVQLVRTVLALAGVCVGAWVVLRWAAQRGIGQGPRGRNVRVLERVMLEPRRSLFLVEVGKRVLLLGGAEGGLSLIAEMKPEDLAAASEMAAKNAPGARFADVLARLRRSTTAATTTGEAGDPTNAPRDARGDAMPHDE